MSNRPSAEKNKKCQTLRKIFSKFIQSERPFDPHPKVSLLARYTNLSFFYRYAWGLGFVQFGNWQFDVIIIH